MSTWPPLREGQELQGVIVLGVEDRVVRALLTSSDRSDRPQRREDRLAEALVDTDISDREGALPAGPLDRLDAERLSVSVDDAK